MTGISIIICCYNSGDKLIPTLTHLANQKLLPAIGYELIIVDNNCTDGTSDIAYKAWLDLGQPYYFTIVRQPMPGLSYARDKGIRTARYNYVIFCDDDNWLCDDYLGKVFYLFEKMPEVALIGGVGEAVADISLPGWFNELDGFGYAVGKQGRQTGFVDSIYGAGMAIRRPVFSAVINDEYAFILSDRSGKSLSSGGDTEICMLILNAGYRIYLDTALTFRHYLSANRLQWNYYLKLRRAFGIANAYIQLYNRKDLGNSTAKENRLLQLLSFAKFKVMHLKYSMFPSYFRNARCANFVQLSGMRATLLFEHKKLEEIAVSIKVPFNKRLPLQHAGKV